jgi:exoribonuclease-2
MNVFYEEDGGFKVGAVLADNAASLQVEAPHGKRSKIKTASVLLRFEQPALSAFMDEAQRTAEEIDVDFMWQCCGSDEFDAQALGREYFGHAPNALEAAGLLLRLHGAPMYFYKKGRGRYKAAPADALKAALASVEKKRLLAEQKQAYIDALAAGRLPAAFAPLQATLLYAPDKNSLEWKALEAAAEQLKLNPARVFERCGALASPHEYHLNRFLFEHFPGGTAFGAVPEAPPVADLPLADATAFSIDDETTTEIDDAFSVQPLPGGNTRFGIHIAAPALGVVAGSPLDAAARARLSTVYFPGDKITMLPPTVIDAYTLTEGGARPALSLYLEVDAAGAIVATHSCCERVTIAANLRHGELEDVFSATALAGGAIEHRFGAEITALWRLAGRLQAQRGKADAVEQQRTEYNFYVDAGRVRIVARRRGSPIDKVVAEMMIYANTEWGRTLREAGFAAAYRAQTGGVARMTTVPTPHDGLGAAQYAWASSPLRRYTDLVNQRQLLALFAQAPAVYAPGAPDLLAALREFELAYDSYAEFQRMMERYWCLRWIEQEQAALLEATVIRDNLVRFDRLPLVVRVPSLRDAAPGAGVRIALSRLDLWELTVHAEYAGPAPAEGAAPEPINDLK